MSKPAVNKMTQSILRPHAEQEFAHELAALAKGDDRERPPSWRLSPWAVVTYVLGGKLPDGTVITPKYVGRHRRDSWEDADRRKGYTYDERTGWRDWKEEAKPLSPRALPWAEESRPFRAKSLAG